MKYYLNVHLLKERLSDVRSYKGVIVGSLTSFTEGAYIPEHPSVFFSDNNTVINSTVVIDGDGMRRASSWKIPVEFLVTKKEQVTLEI